MFRRVVGKSVFTNRTWNIESPYVHNAIWWFVISHQELICFFWQRFAPDNLSLNTSLDIYGLAGGVSYASQNYYGATTQFVAISGLKGNDANAK